MLRMIADISYNAP